MPERKRPQKPAIIDELTASQLEVLKCIASGMSLPAIRQLVKERDLDVTERWICRQHGPTTRNKCFRPVVEWYLALQLGEIADCRLAEYSGCVSAFTDLYNRALQAGNIAECRRILASRGRLERQFGKIQEQRAPLRAPTTNALTVVQFGDSSAPGPAGELMDMLKKRMEFPTVPGLPVPKRGADVVEEREHAGSEDTLVTVDHHPAEDYQ